MALYGCSNSKATAYASKTVYETPELVITQVAPDVYIHTSYLSTQHFGKVACNGMIIQNKKEAVILDTPVNDATAARLINWVNTDLKSSINAVVPTHFHEDCLGGLSEFHKHKISSYAYYKTVEIAASKGLEVPMNSFRDSLNVKVGNHYVSLAFFGEGHTRDNITGYYAPAGILFGGCLIKELHAGKGNLADANEQAWSESVENIRKKYPEVRMVIPGHGKPGGSELLSYTITLFSK